MCQYCNEPISRETVPDLILALISILVISALIINSGAPAFEIDYEALQLVESSGDPTAYNKSSQARGLYQITPICLKDYNEQTNSSYVVGDLYDPAINEKIAKWYLEKRLPEILKKEKIPVTLDNLLIAWYAGAKNDLFRYVKKYKEEIGS